MLVIQDFWETESTRVYLFWVNMLQNDSGPKGEVSVFWNWVQVS